MSKKATNSQLLINEYPLMVLPTLAVKIGLNEAIVIQQIQFWITTNQGINGRDEINFREGRWWSYNSYEAWKKEFPFWSLSTIKRTFYSLERRGLLLSRQFNAVDWDHQKWYAIDYDAVNAAVNGSEIEDDRSCQNEPIDDVNMNQSNGSDSPDRTVQDDPILINRESTENPSESSEGGASPPLPPLKKAPRTKKEDDRMPNFRPMGT